MMVRLVWVLVIMDPAVFNADNMGCILVCTAVVVRNKKNSDAMFGIKLVEKCIEVIADCMGDADGWFVENEDFWIARERTGYHNSLPFAAREFGDMISCVIFE